MSSSKQKVRKKSKSKGGDADGSVQWTHGEARKLMMSQIEINEWNP